MNNQNIPDIVKLIIGDVLMSNFFIFSTLTSVCKSWEEYLTNINNIILFYKIYNRSPSENLKFAIHCIKISKIPISQPNLAFISSIINSFGAQNYFYSGEFKHHLYDTMTILSYTFDLWNRKKLYDLAHILVKFAICETVFSNDDILLGLKISISSTMCSKFKKLFKEYGEKFEMPDRHIFPNVINGYDNNIYSDKMVCNVMYDKYYNIEKYELTELLAHDKESKFYVPSIMLLFVEEVKYFKVNSNDHFVHCFIAFYTKLMINCFNLDDVEIKYFKLSFNRMQKRQKKYYIKNNEVMCNKHLVKCNICGDGHKCVNMKIYISIIFGKGFYMKFVNNIKNILF